MENVGKGKGWYLWFNNDDDNNGVVDDVDDDADDDGETLDLLYVWVNAHI